MQIRPDMLVAQIAAEAPATIKIFQRHQLEFCCGGRIPLAEACAASGLDAEVILAELSAALGEAPDSPDWQQAPLSELIAHIQATYHEPLRDELPRLSAMLAKVVQRHGQRLPETLLPLQATFDSLHRELIDHMAKEDRVLFPAVAALESSADGDWTIGGLGSLDQPIDVMEAEHEAAGEALARMRRLTGGYAPPEDACPTFRGLYYGLAELERDMHQHVHLENHILFPRAAQLARERRQGTHGQTAH